MTGLLGKISTAIDLSPTFAPAILLTAIDALRNILQIASAQILIGAQQEAFISFVLLVNKTALSATIRWCCGGGYRHQHQHGQGCHSPRGAAGPDHHHLLYFPL
ncbi:hypothetical protein Pfo_001372, partial [Paulownia fortunei]